MGNKHVISDLYQMQSLSLNAKVRMTQRRIREWVDEYIMKPWNEGGLGFKEIIDWINEHGNLNIRY